VKDAIKVLLPVLPYLMKFHKRRVLFKGRKLIFICLHILFYLVEKAIVWKDLFFCTIVMKIRKLTPMFLRNFVVFIQ